MDVIAERQLELRVDGESTNVTVKIGRPAPGDSGVDWVCPYEIHFSDRCRSMAMHGADSMQALQLTISVLDAELERGAEVRRGTLYHFDEPFTSMLESSGLEVRKA
jgi:hypothetical protein